MVILLGLAAGAVMADVAVDFRVEVEELRMRGLDDDVITRCGVFIGDHPSLAVGYIERARCYMDLYEYHEAAADLRLAIQYGGGYEAYTLLGECYQDLGYEDEAQVYFDRAESLCNERLVIVVQDPDACFWLGRCYYDLDDYDLCLTWCNRAIGYRPDFFECGFFLGNVYFELRQESEALVWYNRCAEWQPQACRVYAWRARCYVSLGDWDNCDRDLQRCEQINPRYPQTYYVRGLEYERRGQYEEAVQQYGRATEINPRYAQSYLRRGEVLERLGRHDEAQKDLHTAQTLDRGNWQAREERVARVEAQHPAGGEHATGRPAPSERAGAAHAEGSPSGAGYGGAPSGGGYHAGPPSGAEHHAGAPSGTAHAQGGPPGTPVNHRAARIAPMRSDRPRGSVAWEAAHHMQHNGSSHGGGGAHGAGGGAGSPGGSGGGGRAHQGH
jgi:tetratricopeptide (TPR) repeat protein